MIGSENSKNPRDRLLIAVVQGQDANLAIDTLVEEGFGVTRLPSMGGFLGRKSASLLIGVSTENEDSVIAALNRTCRKQVAFIAVPLENSPLPMPAPTPITVGGASIFSLEVEHYEELL